jgi:hypothetical protein
MNISSLKISRTRAAAALPNTGTGGIGAMSLEPETSTLASMAETLAARATALMTCELCGLSGGPFAPAEAAHLRSIHDRMFHGVSSAA